MARKGENAFRKRKCRSHRRKRFHRAKTSLLKAKKFLRAKSSLAMAKMRLPSQNGSHKAIAGIPSEDVGIKGENAFRKGKHSSQNKNFAINTITVLKRHSQMRKCVYLAKMLVTKSTFSHIERKRRLQSQKRVYRAKTLTNE